MSKNRNKIEEIREALRAANRTGYGDEEELPAKVSRYVTVHNPWGKPKRHDMFTDEVEEVTFKK